MALSVRASDPGSGASKGHACGTVSWPAAESSREPRQDSASPVMVRRRRVLSLCEGCIGRCGARQLLGHLENAAGRTPGPMKPTTRQVPQARRLPPHSSAHAFPLPPSICIQYIQHTHHRTEGQRACQQRIAPHTPQCAQESPQTNLEVVLTLQKAAAPALQPGDQALPTLVRPGARPPARIAGFKRPSMINQVVITSITMPISSFNTSKASQPVVGTLSKSSRWENPRQRSMCCWAAWYRPWPAPSLTNRRLKWTPQRWYRVTVWSSLRRVKEGTYTKGRLYGQKRYLC